jgi:hypothetical protein
MIGPKSYDHANSDLIFVNGCPTIVVEWLVRPDGDLPLATIPLDPQYLHPLKGWEDVDYLYEIAVAPPPARA